MTSQPLGPILRERSPYLVLTMVVFGLDRWSKAIVQASFDPQEIRPVIEGFFDLVYFQNTGIAFGLLAGPDSRGRLLVLSAFALVAAVVVVLYSVRSQATERLLQTSLALILGGAIGNLYDRIAAGYVTDFLYFHLGSFSWPAFNVADAGISVGVGLMAIETVRHELRSRT